jgi:hypothetical protein
MTVKQLLRSPLTTASSQRHSHHIPAQLHGMQHVAGCCGMTALSPHQDLWTLWQGRGEHRKCLWAIRMSAGCPLIERFASFHHNAWGQRVAVCIHQLLVSVRLNVAHLQKSATMLKQFSRTGLKSLLWQWPRPQDIVSQGQINTPQEGTGQEH